jgi:DICT domain-containing protein
MPNPELSTAQLAERTGVPAGTLRMWETRHGFPSPVRLPGGHRRYSEQDVEQVRDVARLRAQGLSMPAAIEQVVRAARRLPASVFAGVRERQPQVEPMQLSKRSLLRLTRAVEDEYCARAADGLLLGSFQLEGFYRQSARRWRELARTAALAVALADFSDVGEPAGAAVEVPVAADQALSREWTLLIDAPGAQVCVAAWEQVDVAREPDAERRFEVLWSFEPAVVRSASEVAIEILRRLAPAVAERVPAALDHPVAPSGPELRFAADLTRRMVAYLAGTNART